VIVYEDGRRLTQHSDGTQMMTYPSGVIMVEHPDYATVVINTKVRPKIRKKHSL